MREALQSLESSESTAEKKCCISRSKTYLKYFKLSKRQCSKNKILIPLIINYYQFFSLKYTDHRSAYTLSVEIKIKHKVAPILFVLTYIIHFSS